MNITKQLFQQQMQAKSRKNDEMLLFVFLYGASFYGISFLVMWISTICFV